jgi:hypothetical protein
MNALQELNQAMHTPGLWAAVPCNDTSLTRFEITDSQGQALADVWGELPHAPIAAEEAQANAALMAAAPELLAFAKKVSHICNGDEIGNPVMLLQAFGEEARAAIAKAEGRSC